MKRNQWITVPALALLLMGAGSVHAYAQQSFESKIAIPIHWILR